MSDDFLFAEESEEDTLVVNSSWKILIVDDEPEIHTVTRLALGDFIFQDRNLEFLSAYTGEEAKQLFREHHDIAIVLLDVVMETDHAGLDVARYIREELQNHYTRIILRTGQPGQAPEKEVIINYDINDYKPKTDLTAQKLFTVVISSLRSYRDIVVIDENRRGLQKIIQSSADLFSLKSLEKFIEGIVQQLSSLLGGTDDAVYLTSAVASPVPIEDVDSEQFYVFSASGDYKKYEGRSLIDILSGDKLESCKQALAGKNVVYGQDHVVAYCNSRFQRGALLYMSGLQRQLNELDRNLIEIFAQNVQIAFDNVLMARDIEDTQKEIIERLGQAIDENAVQKSNHVKRVLLICELIGREYGLSIEELDHLRVAVPLHDVGKLGIPVRILRKPGGLTEDEFEVARRHVELGYELLKDSKRPIIRTAALLARDHHEHWDGNGYPRGLKGDEIHLFCRITAIADVYDVLRSKRCYKEAWPQEKALQAIVEQKGKQFEPQLVDLLEQHIEAVENIILELADK